MKKETMQKRWEQLYTVCILYSSMLGLSLLCLVWSGNCNVAGLLSGRATNEMKYLEPPVNSVPLGKALFPRMHQGESPSKYRTIICFGKTYLVNDK